MFKSKYVIQTFFITVFLGLVSFLLFKQYKDFLDLSMADETAYMQMVNRNIFRLIGCFGPFYTLTYKVLHQAIPDFVELHYVGIIGFTILPAFGLAAFLISRRTPFLLVLYCTWALLCSKVIMMFDWWPKISHYTIFIVFVFLIIVHQRIKNNFKKLLYFCLFSFYMAYIRPELYYSAIVLLISSILYLSYQYTKTKKIVLPVFSMIEKLLIVVAIISYIPMYIFWGSPSEGGRMQIALGQHYTYNTIRWNKSDRLPFLYWEETFNKAFGNSESLGDMYQANPTEFKKHIAENCTHYLTQSIDFIADVFIPDKVFPIPIELKYIVLILFLGVIIYSVGYKNYFGNLLAVIKQEKLLLFCLMVFVAPSFGASIAIFPREHYFIIQLIIVYYILYILLSPLHTLQPNHKVIAICTLIFSMVLLWLTPNIKQYDRYGAFGKNNNPVYVKYAYAARKLAIKQPANFLIGEALFPVYISKKLGLYVQFNKNTSFDSLLQQQNIGMLYVSDVILKDKRYYTDSTWHYFLANYQKIGWSKLQLKGKQQYLLYRNNILLDKP